MFRIVLVNIGFIAIAAIPIFIPPLLPGVLSIAVLSAGVLCCFVYLAAAAQCFKKVSDYAAFGFADFFACFKERKIWASGAVVGGAALFAALVVSIVIPFYLNINTTNDSLVTTDNSLVTTDDSLVTTNDPLVTTNDSLVTTDNSLVTTNDPLVKTDNSFVKMAGVIMAVTVFWLLLIGVVSFQFFLPFRSRMDNTVPKTIKKCFIIFFDNTAFCIMCLFYAVVLMVLSVILVFLLPGPAGIVLFLDEALRLRLLKYDWLEENPPPPAVKRPKIPWDAILIDERENTGHRSLRNFIFPWKD
ncbi:MAG: hypothetical protein LBH75_02760 [Treponema sp.]|nr:hypothetical protein [Treponema sp.]